MSNRLFQGVVHQMRDTIDRTIGVVDESGVVIACSDLSRIGEVNDAVMPEQIIGQEGFTAGSYSFKPFGGHPHSEYAVFVEGSDEAASKYASILAVSLNSIKQYYDEKYDRGNFIKNVIMDNILPGDIYLKARELRFNSDVSRACLLVRITTKTDVSTFDIVQNLFPDKAKDFVININENDIALVKEIKPGIETKDLEKLARSIVDTLSSEFYTHCVVGIGTIVTGIKDLARSFKEAQLALEVGKVFDTEKNIVNYENLGIARLIYQLPTTLCEMFLREVFKKGSIETLDQETLFTIQKFFENNLNVSETSRKLFVHRNTLVYRLEKIKKLTGLDLREFDHAIVFKVALMVKKYLTASPIKY
ncbi:MAG: helix-turn-helix domain-containing protein [Clostridia bacterium]|nr:PucR family transcriptional regulator [Oscillospiraceae bacterium]MBQ6797391.1 helix-turn-helix domain-containing protein [Clostridia bacterium]